MPSAAEQRSEPPSSAELGAHVSAVTAALPVVVAALRDTLGAAAVARLAGVTETRAVHQWASGEREVRSRAVETRLRIAFQLVSMLSPPWPASVVSTWFQVPNPHLGYQAPLELLDPGDDAGGRAASVVAAAASRFHPKGGPASAVGVS